MYILHVGEGKTWLLNTFIMPVEKLQAVVNLRGGMYMTLKKG